MKAKVYEFTCPMSGRLIREVVEPRRIAELGVTTISEAKAKIAYGLWMDDLDLGELVTVEMLKPSGVWAMKALERRGLAKFVGKGWIVLPIPLDNKQRA